MTVNTMAIQKLSRHDTGKPKAGNTNEFAINDTTRPKTVDETTSINDHDFVCIT
jgi:hypothetical protein